MTLEDIKKVAVPACSEFKVKRLDLFGSLVRGAGTSDSDVDLRGMRRENSVSYKLGAKKIANWFNGAVLKEMNERRLSLADLKLTPENLVELIKAVEDGIVSNLVGKDVLTAMMDSGKTAGQIIQEKGLAQVSDDSALLAIVDEIIKQNQTVVDQIKQGKPESAGFLVGQAIKQSGGKANPKKLNELFTKRISNV